MLLLTLAFFASDVDVFVPDDEVFFPDEGGWLKAVVESPVDVSSCATERAILAFEGDGLCDCGVAEYCRAAGRLYGRVCLSMEKIGEALVRVG